MNKKTRLTTTSNRTATIGILVGIIAAFIISLILVAVTTGLITGNKLNEESSNWIVFVVRAIAVLIGVLIGSGIVKEKHIITIGVIVAGYLALLLGLGIVMFDGAFKNFWNGLISALIGGVAGYLIRLKSQNKPRKARKIKT